MVSFKKKIGGSLFGSQRGHLFGPSRTLGGQFFIQRDDFLDPGDAFWDSGGQCFGYTLSLG